MKKIEIIEVNAEYRKGLANILINEGAIAVVFEIDDDFDVNSYEGLAEYKPQTQVEQSLKLKFPEVAAWLEAYKGNFDFYLSLKQQFYTKGMLSEKQIACVERAIAQDKARGINDTRGAATQLFDSARNRCRTF